ncbi:MAG: aminodeoxychorismate synthase component I, partial [Pedobacter sp.]
MKTSQTKSDFKHKALHWANQFEVCCFLDSNQYKDTYSAYDFIIAAGVQKELQHSSKNAFEALKVFYEKDKQWM